MSRAEPSPASVWRSRLVEMNTAVRRLFERTYGDDAELAAHKRRLLIAMIERTMSLWGNVPVVAARAPGRVNLMGRHIDHQGGSGNMIAIDRDILMLVSPREDSWIHVENLDSGTWDSDRFKLEEIRNWPSDTEWLQGINSAKHREKLKSYCKHWSVYLKAVLARIQTAFPQVFLPGLNVLASGDIPIAGGLSSSSALVVAFTEALTRLLRLPVESSEFAVMCGEAEWYVGTRGGAGDHAAMKLAKKDRVVHIGFHPLRRLSHFPFPSDYRLAVCHSGILAKKRENVREIFNHRVACYHAAREWFKLEHPALAGRIEHLRDINSSHLGLGKAALFEAMKKIPLSVTRAQILARIREPLTLSLVESGGDAAAYPLRAVMLFGLAECERSRRTPELLRRGEFALFGRWMNISHNGDRVTGRGPNDYSDRQLDGLKERDLAEIAGGYSCSDPNIDRMVDIAIRQPGVLGAQLSGAGLGGCMMALVRGDGVQDLITALENEYYRPGGFEPVTLICRPVAGSESLPI